MTNEWEVRDVVAAIDEPPAVVEGFDRLWPALALRDRLNAEGDGRFEVFGRLAVPR